MLDATFMRTLAYAYLEENAVEKRIHSAASLGNVGISFTPDELSAEMYARLEAAGYTITADVFRIGNLYVRWG